MGIRNMEIIKEFKSEETFEIKNYTDSHSQLLLRNWTAEEIIDLLFVRVFYIELPLNLKGIIISPATQEETYRIKSKYFHPLRQDRKVYAIASCGERYFVGAAYLSIKQYFYQDTDTSISLEAEMASSSPKKKFKEVITASYKISFD
jgi:hypothetical protein